MPNSFPELLMNRYKEAKQSKVSSDRGDNLGLVFGDNGGISYDVQLEAHEV